MVPEEKIQQLERTVGRLGKAIELLIAENEARKTEREIARAIVHSMWAVMNTKAAKELFPKCLKEV